MLSVAVCDDEELFCRQIGEYVHTLADSLQIAVEMEAYTSAEALLARKKAPDILFLDIEIGEENGIATARRLRAGDGRDTVIVFMTNHIRYAPEGYKVQAYRYLLKPISYTQFCDEVSVIFRQAGRPTAFLVHTANGDSHVRPDDLRFIETEPGKRLMFHTRNDVLEASGTLTPWAKQLGENFFRIHSSFLLNLQDVKRVEKESVLLSGGEELPISRHRRKAFLEALSAFVKKERF